MRTTSRVMHEWAVLRLAAAVPGLNPCWSCVWINGRSSTMVCLYFFHAIFLHEKILRLEFERAELSHVPIVEKIVQLHRYFAAPPSPTTINGAQNSGWLYFGSARIFCIDCRSASALPNFGLAA